MSSYKKSLIFCVTLLIFGGCVPEKVVLDNKEEPKKESFKKVKIKTFDLEDQYIVAAIESENQRLYYDAKELYLQLFENTNNYQYLVKSLTLATQLKEYEFVKVNASKNLIDNIKEEEIILKLYTFSLFKLKQKDEAVLNAKKLVSLYKNSANYELLGSIYLEDKQYQKAYESFENSFSLSNSNSALLTLTNIQFYYLLQKNDAIKRLEKNIESRDYDFALSLQLLAFYEDIKANDKIKEQLEKSYAYYKKNDNQLLVNKTKALFIKYLVNDNIAYIINFLEKNGEQDEILLNLYKITNQMQKAYDLLNKLYSDTNNLNYLAQQAIIEFEMATDKKAVLFDVVAKFEQVLAKIDNHVYQNYLAYILIDYEIDIRKGLNLVIKALSKEPTNVAYIDTLAWGQYKLHSCKEAIKNMKMVVDEVGLDDAEIKLHWEKIKECK